MHGCHIVAFSTLTRDFYYQGPRSNFEIGGEPLVTQYWGGGGGGGGGTRHFFLLFLYNFRNIGGGGTCPPCPPTPRSLIIIMNCEHDQTFFCASDFQCIVDIMELSINKSAAKLNRILTNECSTAKRIGGGEMP